MARLVAMGKRQMAFDPSGEAEGVRPLNDSTELLERKAWSALRERLEEDGYLFLRGAIGADTVKIARKRVLAALEKHGGVLDSSRPVDEGILNANCDLSCMPFMEGRNSLTHSAELLAVLESEMLRAIFCGLFGCDDVRTFDFKWLRAMPQESFTGAHFDSVYMGRGTDRLLTCWIPMGDTTIEMGTVAVCEGSHKLDGFARLRATYGQMDHERDRLDGSGWFTEDATEVSNLFGGQWKTRDFAAGDILIFSMHTMHMSTRNTTNKVRISADVRWQPAAEPADSRYVGDVEQYLQQMSKAGAWSKDVPTEASDDRNDVQQHQEAIPKVTMQDLRARWGFPVNAH